MKIDKRLPLINAKCNFNYEAMSKQPSRESSSLLSLNQIKRKYAMP